MTNLEFKRNETLSSQGKVLKHLFSKTKEKTNDGKERKIPKGTIPLFDESHAQWRVIGKNGPEFYFHVAKNDVEKIVDLFKRSKNPNEPELEQVKAEIKKIEEGIAESIEKMGVKKEVLSSALESIGFKDYTEFADALLTMSVEAYDKGNSEEKGKKKIINEDGSLDIRQPLYFLIKKDRWICFGEEWFKFPVKEDKTIEVTPEAKPENTPEVSPENITIEEKDKELVIEQQTKDIDSELYHHAALRR